MDLVALLTADQEYPMNSKRTTSGMAISFQRVLISTLLNGSHP